MRAFVLAMCIAAAPVSSAMAQSVEDLARSYAQMPEVRQMMSEMFSPGSMAAQFKSGLPAGFPITDAQLASVGQVLSNEMMELRPRLEDIMQRRSAEMFSAPELKALIAFYQSPEGASVMAKMAPFMQLAMADLGPELQAMQARMMPRIQEIMSGE
ncbi:DUF2059 domain-containing protein [Mesobacterium sp. TK19101]|uniref:DUF2059 domain-containing protein n=1 Tax=Mesobacterium hydrothermale TaxID=3111907 RepID=A0ABU6HH49_9RHOB|nr:DUF2059 domain-containing protein [Mesobacterium sp. TK19101]MEC3861114.1 DUF2059 domain-containing protein [Mesobacterium sp. TK19101]